MVSNKAEALIMGLGAIVGEIGFGVNGPFLFERFGLYVPVAVATAVVIGAWVGCASAALLYRLSQREHAATPAPAIRQTAHPKAA